MRSLSQMIDENNLIFGFGALTDRNSKILEMPIQTRIALCFFTLKFWLLEHLALFEDVAKIKKFTEKKIICPTDLRTVDN